MTFKKSRVRESRMLGSVRAKAKWLSYSTNPQLDEAFHEVSSRTAPIEPLHAAVNQAATNLTFALYRGA